MKAEINMINVEDGDAIFVGLDKENGEKALIVIDGGYGWFYEDRVKKRLEELLPRYNNEIRLMICTHYDNDHLVGARKILDDHNDKIKEIWIHKVQGSLSDQIEKMEIALDQMILEGESQKELKHLSGISDRLGLITIESYRELIGFIKKIKQYGLESKVCEATRGKKLLGFEEFFEVVGPTASFYNKYLNDLVDEKYAEDLRYNLIEGAQLLDSFQEFTEAEKMRKDIDNFNACEALETSSVENRVTATNLVSIVTLLQVGEKKFLFTGDAGIESFEDEGLLDEKVRNLFWLDVPHHGSKNNTSKKMLEHFNPEIAFVSGNGGKNRPSSKITYCLKRKRTKDNQFVTNSPESTWYLKIDDKGKITRVYR